MTFDPEAQLAEGREKLGAAVILSVTLSIHAILSGLAIGAEQTGVALLAVTGALAVHKFAASFTLGSSLVGAKSASDISGRSSLPFRSRRRSAS